MIGGRQTYLWFEGAPLFPFGHGLSYAAFSYGELTAEVTASGVRVAFEVTNTGEVTADEVAQLYGRAVDPSVPRPRRELLGHRRVTLAPGESTRLFFALPLSAFAFWDVAAGRWRVEPGAYELLAGASSEDVRRSTTVTLEGEPGAPRPVVEHGLGAADFDEQSGMEIVDRTKEAGDAVTPLGGKDGELLYRRCDMGAGVREVSVEVSGAGTVEVAVDGGPPLASLSPKTPTAGPYAYVTLTAPVAGAPGGVRDVRLRVRGRCGWRGSASRAERRYGEGPGTERVGAGPLLLPWVVRGRGR